MKKHTTAADLPTTEQIARERSRLRYKRRYGRTLRSTAAICSWWRRWLCWWG